MWGEGGGARTGWKGGTVAVCWAPGGVQRSPAAPSSVASVLPHLPPNPLTRVRPAGEPHRPQLTAGPVRRARRRAQECRCATTTTTPTTTTTATATTPMATAASRQGAARRGRVKRPPPWTFRPSAHRGGTCTRSALGCPASVRPGCLPRARRLCRELPNEPACSPITIAGSQQRKRPRMTPPSVALAGLLVPGRARHAGHSVVRAAEHALERRRAPGHAPRKRRPQWLQPRHDDAPVSHTRLAFAVATAGCCQGWRLTAPPV